MAQSVMAKRVEQLRDVQAQLKKEKDPEKIKNLKALEFEMEQSILEIFIPI